MARENDGTSGDSRRAGWTQKEAVLTVDFETAGSYETSLKALMLDAVGDSVIVHDLEGNIIYGNQSAHALRGYSREELLRLNLRDILGSGTRADLKQRLADLTDKGSQAVESVNRRKDGSEFPVEVRSRLVAIEGQQYVLSVARDISRRHWAEAALRESEERFQQVAENAVEWVWEVDRDGIFKYSSPVVRKILGHSPEELVDRKRFIELFAPETTGELRQSAISMFARQVPIRGFVNACLHCSGRLVILETNGVPFHNPKGDFLGYRGTSRDITMQRALEEERERLISELQESLASIKQLKGLIPICASCKKVRDDQGYWQQVDVYLRDHTEADVSHGLCQECAEKLYPEFAKGKED